MGFNDYFLADPPYMTGIVAILIVLEIALVFFLIRRNPYLRSLFTKISNYFQKFKKTPKPPPSKEVDITIVINESHDNFTESKHAKISDKLSNKMSKLDKLSRALPQETINQNFTLA